MDKGIDGYLQDNTGEKGVNPYDKKNFTYDRQKDEYLCPKGHKITFMAERYDRQKGKTVRIYKGQSCAECKEQRTCTDQKDGIRYLKMFPHEGERNAMMAKMKTPQAKEIYKLRQQTVEPVIGDIKENKGLKSFLTRGVITVRTEFNLICAAANIRKIWAKLQEKNTGGREPVYPRA